MTGFGVYVHWPFCLSKCPYCDFNSHVRAAEDTSDWLSPYLTELDFEGQSQGNRTVTSVFFGGGTPSLMPPILVEQILEKISKIWNFSPDAEITLEANPTSVEKGRFQAFKAAGVNRVSLGVQSLRDDALKLLGRGHSAAEAIDAIQLARSTFDRYSFDLIYTRPGQTVSAWVLELEEALKLAGDHLSLYQLTIEPGTVFHTLARRGELPMPDDDDAAVLFESTQELMNKAGLKAYEISNHAVENGACRHNLTYWRYEDYVGIGPGAHGRLTRSGRKFAVSRRRSPEGWRIQVQQQGHGIEHEQELSLDDRLAECVLMGLRLQEGITDSRFIAASGRSFSEALDERRISSLTNAGLIIYSGETLRATPAGQQRLNAVIDHLLG